MNTAKWIIGFIAAFVVCYFILVESKIIVTNNSSANVEENTTKGQVKQRFNEDGSLKSDVTIVDGVRHGVAHNYYSDGSVHSEIHYKHGKKDSISIWYYENGDKYRTTPYKEGKKHGMQTKYYRNGKLMAEIPYQNNVLQPGTKEYSETGKLITTDLDFNVRTINKTSANQVVIVEVAGKKLDKIIDFKGFIKPTGNKINGERNDNAIRFHLPSRAGQVKKVEVSVWLTVKTNMNNKKIIEKNLWVELGKN